MWEFEIEPGSDEDLTMRIDGGRPCDEPGAICTEDGRSLSEGIATTVVGPGPAPLTAAFEGIPEAHDGEDAFHFRVAFSEEIGIGFRSMRDASFTVDGGEVTGARRVDRRHDLWRITVEPDGEGDVTVTLPARARVRGLRGDLHPGRGPQAVDQHGDGHGGRPRGRGGGRGADGEFRAGGRRSMTGRDGVQAQDRVQRGHLDQLPDVPRRSRCRCPAGA